MARQYNMMGKIALGATGLALTTGAVVAAVMLARNKTVRETVKKGARGALKGAREVLKKTAITRLFHIELVQLVNAKIKEAEDNFTKHGNDELIKTMVY